MSASGELIEKPERPESTVTAPVPYYPVLKDETGTAIGAIMVSYLETYHPAPQDTSPQRSQRISSLPVRIDSERVCADLRISRRTLVVILSEISVWYPNDSRRSRAHGASREFIEPRHSRFGTAKLYSVVGPRKQNSPFRFDLRRNSPRLAQILNDAVNQFPSTPCPYLPAPEVASPAVYAPSKLAINPRVAELLERASVLGGDRRGGRYERMRRGEEGGIAPAAVVGRIAKKSVRSRDADATG